MVTRKDLLGYRLDEAVNRCRTGALRAPLGGDGPESPLATPRPGGLGPHQATPDRF